MALREGAARTGFQVALEGDGSLLVRKPDDDVELSRTVARSVRAAARVVIGEARGDVVGETDVVVSCGTGALQNVDDSLAFGHPVGRRQRPYRAGRAEYLRK
jgi:hypothetical protein